MTALSRPAPYRGIPGRYMPKARARAIHAYQRAAFWMAVGVACAAWPVGWLITGDAALAVAMASAALALSALVACTLLDLVCMRIPNPVSLLPVAAAVLWWVALGMGASITEGAGYGRLLYSPVAPAAGTGSLVPHLWAGGIWVEIATSFLGAFLVSLPILGSFMIGMMGGGDVKFIPPFALYLGWSLSFDLLFLTLLFGGGVGLVMMGWRWFCKGMTRARPGAYPELERMAHKRTLAYAPAIAIAGIFCLAAKWEGLFG